MNNFYLVGSRKAVEPRLFKKSLFNICLTLNLFYYAN